MVTDHERSIMTDTIFNEDGSVYMTFGPSVPSRGDLEGWTVRQVCSGTHGPTCPHGKTNGTYSLVRTDVESFNGLLKIIGELSDMYEYRPQPSKITDGTYRWTFEREYPGGHRGSDMIIASKIH
jgi:hypothetical protein